MDQRVTLGALSKIYDPEGLISAFAITGRIIFQQICIERPIAGWDTPLERAIMKEFEDWIKSAADLNSLRIPRCLQRHRMESREFHTKHPYLDSSCDGSIDKGPRPGHQVPLAGPTQIPDAHTPEIIDEPSKFYEVVSRSLHTFGDAAKPAYGAMIFMRTTYSAGPVTCRLVFSKARVSPRQKGKRVTIPRLELMAALLGAQWADKVKKALSMEEIETVYWSDSQCVIWWIHSSKPLKTFVHNRVRDIKALSEPAGWRHVPGELNPADQLSRGISTPQELATSQTWFNAPEFLYKEEDHWPKNEMEEPSEEALEEVAEKGKDNFQFTTEVEEHTAMWNWHWEWRIDFKQWVRVVQVFRTMRSQAQKLAARRKADPYSQKQQFKKQLGIVRKELQKRKEAFSQNFALATEFYKNRKEKPNAAYKQVSEEISISVEYTVRFEEVKLHLFRMAQQDEFSEELSRLEKGEKVKDRSVLAHQNPALSEDNLIMVRGRFTTEQATALIVLPKKHSITKLYLRHIHAEELKHIGSTKWLLSECKKTLFVPRLRQAVENTVKNCYRCRVRWPQTFTQTMAPVHRSRLPGNFGEGDSPFSFRGSVSIDFFGSFLTVQGRGITRPKRWVMVVFCNLSRAIHMELVRSLEAADCLEALLSHFLKKGCPKAIISDEGTNLKCASKEIKKLHENVRIVQPKIDEEMSAFPAIEWIFTAPSTPSANGNVERSIGTIKKAMKAASTCNPLRSLRDHEVQLLLLRVESVLNSRPLAMDNAETNLENPLTPNHFAGSGLSPIQVSVPLETLAGSVHLKKWHQIEKAMIVIWNEWWTQYFTSIRKVARWTKGEADIRVGSLVVVCDDEEFRTRVTWPIAMVKEVHKDSNGRIQTVTIKLRGHITKRGIRQIAPVPMESF